ncbi:terminase [Pseudomonas aeruginosa]|uniref:terminase n=1 Tax=Pseudomonas aeruginosa TaxID=287 RepID=UPI000F523066|nr:terminase [Pseudomonas aeruginosa]MBX5886677.1 terminase [Pseudomonas aeruginosa]MDI3613351.1 terminase [Pseudomonas aeruginosa]MDI3902564.1 terminase [Pseudomonas aeruginosa]MDI4006049.1 terminase [Pseudomonas aeruginosa]MDI4012924.1 terminase [Pseudomonas aeruginosa]
MNAPEKIDPEQQLIEDIASFTHDPLGFSMYAYPWGEGELEGVDGPREWQRQVMNDIASHLSNADTRYQPLMISIASGHGIGKSAEMGMLLNWGMSTCEDCKVVVTANTDNQLRTKTWPEISKWFRLAINRHWFNITATKVASVDPDHSDSWKADAVPWSEHNTEAFAGLHNKGKRIILIFDEASNIADKVWEVAEGALTDEQTEIIWLAFGNPTRNVGRFRECFRKFRHRWIQRQIDSRTVDGTNKDQIAKWAADYGEDSDFFKVRVRGLFPSSSDLQFIGTGLVDAAMARVVTEAMVSHAPVVIGVDPSWSGDDEFAIYLRQGLHSKLIATYQKSDDDVLMAQRIAQLEDQYKADAVFVDFGYGTGIVSAARAMGRNWTLVQFGGASSDPAMLNKRGEIWNAMKEWLKAGGELNDQQTADEISAPEYRVKLDGKIVLEDKAELKKRAGISPNRADALALTFSFPVVKKSFYAGNGGHQSTYDPFS